MNFKRSTWILLVCAVCICYANRQIEKFQVNPNCTAGPCLNASLVYVKSVGDDAIHYLWTTHGGVSMLMATTVKEAEVNVNWDKFLSTNTSGSINFSVEANATSAVVFTRLYEYDDVNDDVDVELVATKNVVTHRTTDFLWANVSASGSQAQFWNLKEGVLASSALELNLKAFVEEGNEDELPSLKHSANSYQLEIVLNRFLTRNFVHTRFAVELLVTDTQVAKDNQVQMNKEKSIDDEYTPGVFLTYTMKPVQSKGCFLYWKPVCYTSNERTTEYSTNTQQDFHPEFQTSNRTEEMRNSLAYAYYGDKLWNLATTGLNVSFGLQDDKFYQKNNYSTWTVVIGSGSPSEEKFSSTVIIVIVVGFGIPALAILVGGSFIIVRNIRKKPEAEDPKLIEEDEDE